MEAMFELHGISKSFRNTKALEKVSLVLYPGEVHALLGENGAGKSTLLNIMSGSLKPDEGEMFFKGEKVSIDSTHAAKKLGIVKVHQELQLIPEMTVYENIFLGSEITRGPGLVNFQKMKKEADELLTQVDADFKSSLPIKRLSIAQQQMVEIAKALLLDSPVVILDEPTSSLTDKEITKLFGIIENLKNAGKAILFVSHRMEEIFQIADRVTILRDGHYIDSMPSAGLQRDDLIVKLTGRKIQSVFNEKSLDADETEKVLSVRNLKDANGVLTGDGVSFDLYKGEILGFSGLVGSGRSETMRLIFGADKLKSGTIEVFGKPMRIRSIQDSIRQGIALIPENRKLEGFVGLLPNMSNIAMSSYRRLQRGPFLLDRDIRKDADIYMKMLRVKPDDLMKHTHNLSGGNQQKVVVAKWMATTPRILIMDEPTRGIDVGAKEEIYKLMNELASQGVSIIMISSELPEILSMSNRIAVMFEGHLTKIVNREDATEEKILNYAMGGHG